MASRLPAFVLGVLFVAPVAHGSPALAAQEPAPSEEAMSNADVVRMTQAGLEPPVILTAIRKAARHAFDLSPDGLIALKKSGVHQSVIVAMLETEPHPSAPAPTPRAPRSEKKPSREGSGGGGRGLTIGLVAAGAAAAGVGLALAESGENGTPRVTSLSISPPGHALVAATKLGFSGAATDPEGDPLTFGWDFGDGTKASGPTAVHVYDREGVFEVALKVTDAGGGSDTARATVTARTLTGVWAVVQEGKAIGTAQIAQNGPAVSGWVADPINPFGGRVNDPRAVTMSLFFRNCRTAYVLAGIANETLSRIAFTGPVNCLGDPFAFDLAR